MSVLTCRYTKMAEEHPQTWWLLSFFAVGIAQQPMLCWITAPYYSVHFHSSALDSWDALALGMCVTGLVVAYLADNTLFQYMADNEVVSVGIFAPILLMH